MGRSFRTGEILNRMPFSSIRDHSHQEDHIFGERDFKIVCHFNSMQEALLGERILIERDEPELNGRV